ncbi:MAG: SUMF1/EgtB/PvdO family nonheme iron enzyme [Phycisphaeraceae bacterium]|nr:SUMF1/EgtB/PvdO family nonheme iron enzyme [Phycisphaerales bacterium]MCB9859350.1 SUMF1/EgtB/PvdO family nonheme iron enzyme [Phycisphaeraceae bacterium]
MTQSFAVCALAAGAYAQIAHEPLLPYVETVPNTVVEFSMVPVASGMVTLTTRDNETMMFNVDPFWVASTETTWDLYDIYVYKLDGDVGNEITANKDQQASGTSTASADAISRPTKPYLPPDRGFGHAGYPAMSITYEGATNFCKWLSVRTGKHYRLPTEAEWALVADRAKKPVGVNTEIGIEVTGWNKGNCNFTTHPVAQIDKREPGVYDIFGNVAEWVTGADGMPVAAGGSYVDAQADIGPNARVYQTSAWNQSDPQFPKSQWWLADCSFVGFRVVCDPTPVKPSEETPGTPDAK